MRKYYRCDGPNNQEKDLQKNEAREEVKIRDPPYL